MQDTTVRTTPFHARTAELNQTGLWSHWSNHLAARRYQLSDKAEYFAVRDSAGIFDTSPLFKLRIRGRDAERFLAGMLLRDVRAGGVGQAQYTCWLEGDGYVVEDGVVLHTGQDEYLLTSAEPNFSWFAERVGHLDVSIADASDELAALALQGPRSRELLARLAPAVERLPYFGVTAASIAGSGVTISRTGFTGDLGYEVWVAAEDALPVWDAVWESAQGRGLMPFGLDALEMLRIEAGLLLLGVDFHSSRYAWNDAQRSTPLELGWSWMAPDLASDERAFIGRRALERELRDAISRWTLRGLVVDWRDYERVHDEAGLLPPKDHTPVLADWMLYAVDDGARSDADDQAGYATSFLYSPILQRHIAIARVRPDLALPSTRLRLEFTVNHRYEQVAAEVVRLPFFNPGRRTA